MTEEDKLEHQEETPEGPRSKPFSSRDFLKIAGAEGSGSIFGPSKPSEKAAEKGN